MQSLTIQSQGQIQKEEKYNTHIWSMYIWEWNDTHRPQIQIEIILLTMSELSKWVRKKEFWQLNKNPFRVENYIDNTEWFKNIVYYSNWFKTSR